jgi:hypothetical protein
LTFPGSQAFYDLDVWQSSFAVGWTSFGTRGDAQAGENEVKSNGVESEAHPSSAPAQDGTLAASAKTIALQVLSDTIKTPTGGAASESQPGLCGIV